MSLVIRLTFGCMLASLSLTTLAGLQSRPSSSFLPHVSGWMFLLVLANLGSPGQRAVKRLCVCTWSTIVYNWNANNCNAEFSLQRACIKLCVGQALRLEPKSHAATRVRCHACKCILLVQLRKQFFLTPTLFFSQLTQINIVIQQGLVLLTDPHQLAEFGCHFAVFIGSEWSSSPLCYWLHRLAVRLPHKTTQTPASASASHSTAETHAGHVSDVQLVHQPHTARPRHMLATSVMSSAPLTHWV